MPIVTLNARYKSATVDEFIEQHALDVGPRGIYIKTESPIPLGTLLEFEIQIAGKQPVIAGVGRVVWRRDTAHEGPNRPVGVGVKFVKVSKASQEVIDKIVSTRADAGKRYDSEAEMPSPAGDAAQSAPADPPAQSAPRVPGAQPAVAAPVRRPFRAKQTLMGVGASLPPVVSPPLPPPVAPPRRPNSLSAPPAPHPPPHRPSRSAPTKDPDDDEKEDLTLMGDLPEMPEERKTTLVGVGAPVLPAGGHRLPRPLAPPRRSHVPPPISPTPSRPAAKAPMFPDDLDSDMDPDEQTRMQPVADLDPKPSAMRPRASLPPALGPPRRADGRSRPPRSLSPEPFELPPEPVELAPEPEIPDADVFEPEPDLPDPQPTALQMPVLPQATPGPPLPPEPPRAPTPRYEPRPALPAQALMSTQPTRVRSQRVKLVGIAGAALLASAGLVLIATHPWTGGGPSQPAGAMTTAALPATTAKTQPVTTASAAAAPVASPAVAATAPPPVTATPTATAVQTAAEVATHPPVAAPPPPPPPPEPPAGPEPAAVATTAPAPARPRAVAPTATATATATSPVTATPSPAPVAKATPTSAQPAPRAAKPARIDDGF
jgi:uncharacterized protein (TIGR02266 family)